MKCIVEKEFNGVPTGDTRSRAIVPGEVLTGEIAEVAVREKWAKEVPDDYDPEAEAKAEADKKSAAETKAKAARRAELEAMTVDDLKKLAADKGYDLTGLTVKADIVTAIGKAEAAK